MRSFWILSRPRFNWHLQGKCLLTGNYYFLVDNEKQGHCEECDIRRDNPSHRVQRHMGEQYIAIFSGGSFTFTDDNDASFEFTFEGT